ncbi:MAG: hypothetical protein IJO71_06870 [Microbacterium sp.]|uniref:hypothetical protein n=1 Tax=Microbacterium sp. TaxID=51671 RepID=UPI0025ED6FFE|nr:hypothetical protein [Microbacterium sp.]MBQ9916907.1 hypothetical protein [Microbacterium sp.]
MGGVTGCRYGCCTPEVAALPDGGWKSTEKGWVIDDRRAEHLRREWAATSARIDRTQGDYPRCKGCGQRVLALDAAGLCSRVTESHKAYRARLGLPPVPAGRGGRR